MDNAKLTDLGALLKQATDNIDAYDQQVKAAQYAPTVHVPNVGNALSLAYEQLRNASENIEDHLLFQGAILRFYKRNISFSTVRQPSDLGRELVIELTQAEYLKNDTVAIAKVDMLNTLITELYGLYWNLAKSNHSSRRETIQKWVLEILTVKSEQIFNNPIRVESFATFAHTHFTPLINIHEQVVEGEKIDEADYPVLLYIAIHKALLKSNDANVRNGLFDLYSITMSDSNQFVAFNKKYDILAASKTTAKISRLVSRNGAPLRVVRSTFFSEYDELKVIDLHKEPGTLGRIETQIDEEYKQVRKKVNMGIFKSIIFLLITKAIIGLVVEIPYDIFVTGSIVIVPLLINLLFPPLFIAVTALTFKLPSERNKIALTEYIRSMLYTSAGAAPTLKYPQSTGKSYVFNVLYFLMFIVAFYVVASRLAALDFNIVQGFIFFVFLSTASFLGYRLTVQITELQIITTNQGAISLIRDFLYAPFIFVGRRISYRFARMNIIAQILDIVIELPLKTILRLMRQWTIFLNNKKDELL
jgi:hypothetical protein